VREKLKIISGNFWRLPERKEEFMNQIAVPGNGRCYEWLHQ
jgi:hypothetical protein